jgi:predicted AAA+ superfamily ATPase
MLGGLAGLVKGVRKPSSDGLTRRAAAFKIRGQWRFQGPISIAGLKNKTPPPRGKTPLRRTPMSLLTVFDLCTPREDVLDGTITDSDFAANLARVLRGDATPDYLDPKRFFANTYPTEGLKGLLTNVCGRLSGKGSVISAVFRLDTSFGGGKTHGLIALVHAAHGMKGASNVAEFVDPAIVPTGSVRIAAFDGENADAANGRPMGDGVRAFTPWGEIAYQLAAKAGYEVVRKSDQDRIAPGTDTIRELFGNDPVLIVLDELGEYLRKVQHMDGRDQLTAFMKALFTAIETTSNAAIVYTLAVQAGGKSVDAFAAENEFLASAMLELESVSGRKATILNPTKDDETAKVIRRRIFSRIDDAAAADVIEAYKNLWAASPRRPFRRRPKAKRNRRVQAQLSLSSGRARHADQQDGDSWEFSTRPRDAPHSRKDSRAHVGEAPLGCDGHPCTSH